MNKEELEALAKMVAKAEWNVKYHQEELDNAKIQLRILKKQLDEHTKN